MISIEKELKFKIISLLFAGIFFVTSVAYGIDLPEKNHLRKPLSSNRPVGGGRDDMRMVETARYLQGDNHELASRDSQLPSLLAGDLHEVLPEQTTHFPLEERSSQRWYGSGSYSSPEAIERTRQEEHTSEGVQETRRYSEFFDDNAMNRDWPVCNIVKDRILARWLNDLISLEGKTVVHYRSEYYPFFGLEAARYGANSYLVDPRDIPYVEDFIRGQRQFSREQYLHAQKNVRQISPMGDGVAKYAERLLKLPPAQLIGIIVRSRLNMAEYIWNRLTDVERRYYIFRWIKDNPGFSLDAARYFNSSTHSRSGQSNNSNWWALSDEERLPYVLQYLQENFTQAIRSEVQSAALYLLREKSFDSLTDEEKFSYSIGDIYGRLIVDDIMSGRISPESSDFDRQWTEAVERKMFSEEGDKEDTKNRVQFAQGKELENVDMQPSSVDVIFSEYALNFVEDSVRFSQGVQKLLKPAGVFVGYIKGEGIRDIASVEKLRAVLINMGFEEANIVIVKGNWNRGSGVTLGEGDEYIFLARKSSGKDSAAGKSLPFISETEHVLATTVDFSVDSIRTETQDERTVVRDWQANRTLFDVSQQVVSLNERSSTQARAVAQSLFRLAVGREEEVDAIFAEQLLAHPENINNLIRTILARYGEFSHLQEAIDSLSCQEVSFMLDDLQQLYLIRRQLGYLLQDLTELFTDSNLFMPIDVLATRIISRAEVIGDDALVQSIRSLVDTVSAQNMSLPDRQARLLDAQQYLINYLRDYNYFIFVECVPEAVFYSRHEYPDGPSETNAYSIQTSIGNIVHVSAYQLNGETYYVDEVHRPISQNQRVSGQYVNIGGTRHYMVYVDMHNHHWRNVQRAYESKGVTGLLVRKQWGEALPQRAAVADTCSKSTAFHEILHDRFPDLGETPSFLYEIAHGPQPFVRLVELLNNLSEIQEGGDLFYIISLINPQSRSQHYQASRMILSRYLVYILEQNLITTGGLRQIIERILVDQEGVMLLEETAVESNRDAIVAALSHLSEEEARNVAMSWLEEDYGFVDTSAPRELTVSLPMPESLAEEADDKALMVTHTDKDRIIQAALAPLSSTDSVIGEDRNLPAVVKNSLDKVLSASDATEQTNLVIGLAESLATVNLDSAVSLVNTSLQRQAFPRAKGLLRLAIKMEDIGNRNEAVRLLREAESILEAGKSDIPDSGTASIMGTAYFLFDDIIALKEKLGLSDEIDQDTASLGACLLPDGISLDQVDRSKLTSLIDYAVRRRDSELLSQIGKIVLAERENAHPEGQLALELHLGLAEAKIGNRQRAYEILMQTANSEIGWVSAKGIVDAARALANLGYVEDADRKIREIQAKKEANEHQVGVADHYLNVVAAEIAAKQGNIAEAKRMFQFNIQQVTTNRAYEYSRDESIRTIINGQIKANLLDDAWQATKLMRKYDLRIEALLEIARAYERASDTTHIEEILIEAGHMAENIEDDGLREVVKLRIATERNRISYPLRGLDVLHNTPGLSTLSRCL